MQRKQQVGKQIVLRDGYKRVKQSCDFQMATDYRNAPERNGKKSKEQRPNDSGGIAGIKSNVHLPGLEEEWREGRPVS